MHNKDWWKSVQHVSSNANQLELNKISFVYSVLSQQKTHQNEEARDYIIIIHMSVVGTSCICDDKSGGECLLHTSNLLFAGLL